ncbi:MAG TPA: FTR1 family protein [Ktedonobacterales bacterium]|jgi:high-affinity iron transporter|nr:FTR1 family protein [Ktedonobacterales bacterium]
MLPAFILLLREGLEASLVVSILLAALRQLGKTREVRAVWIGVSLAVVCSAVGGYIIYSTVREYSNTTFQTVFETITYAVAIVLLTTMTFWMQRHSRTLKKEITAQASVAGSGFALGLLAFTTVGREGLESAVFALAFAFQTTGALWLTGAVLGVLASVALSWAIYRMGYRLDFRLFFRWMGALLLVFAAGLVADTIQNAQELGWIRFGNTHLWSTAHLLSEDSMVGDMLHAFIGYAESPTVLQLSLYLLFLLVVGGYFLYITRKPSRGKSVVATQTVAPASHS